MNLNEWIILEAQLHHFAEQFTAREQPYVLTDRELLDWLLQHGHLVYTRAEFFENFPDFIMQYGQLYNVWSYPSDAFVWFADDDAFDALDRERQQQLHLEQVSLQRGHVYSSEWFDSLPLAKNELGRQSTGWVNSSQGMRLVLHHRTWRALSPELQVQWVRRWLETENEETEPFLSGQFDPRLTPTQIRLLECYAGKFASHSGPNCFAAATAFAVSREPQSHTIIQRWLHPEPMFRLLEAQHYHPLCEWHSVADVSGTVAGDVCVWFNSEGTAIHAAFALSSDWVFQTMGQSWFQP